MNYNDLAKYFVNASVQFKQIFIYEPQLAKQVAEITYVSEAAGWIVPLQGKSTLAINDVPYCAEFGTMLHIGKGMVIKQKKMMKESSKFAVIYYNSTQDELLQDVHFKLEINNPKEILHTVKQLKAYNEQPAAVASLKCQVTFYKLLEQVIDDMQRGQESEYCLNEILAYIHTHYQQALSVTEIANCFNIERRHLAYIFKRHTGMSPLNYLTEYRIRLAKELLRQQQYPIMKVAELVGFEDNLYFSRIFKKRTGHSPTAYRETFTKVHS